MKKINFKDYKIVIYIVVFLFFLLYFVLLPINIESSNFRFIFGLILFLFLCYKLYDENFIEIYKHNRQSHISINKQKFKYAKKYIMIFAGFIVFLILIQFLASPLVNSQRYYDMITVNEDASFVENIEDIEQMKVPVVDKDLAFRLGDKKIGEIKGLGSQYTVNNYTMIETNGELYWVGSLEYTGFFKWIANRDQGTPGYIKISATNPSNVELVTVNMKYVPSAYFGDDMSRKIYFSGHMTDLMVDYSFEIDDEGNPYWVVTDVHKKFLFSSGTDTQGVIIMNAVTGETTEYDVEDAPEWVDRIQPSYVIMQQLNYWGNYVHGYLNSLFAKKEVLQVTDGYNYVYNNGDFYLYTGLTSVGSDESTVGFALANMRTKETTFYRIGGATEQAARKSAEGAVQDLGYRTNWPVLVNISGNPTYFMTLKDDEGLIKKYAYVNVKEYSIVGIGNTLTEAKSNYLKNLASSGSGSEVGDLTKITGTVSNIKEIIIDGTTNYLIVLEEMPNKVFQAPFSNIYEIPLTKVGDRVEIGYYDSTNKVYIIETYNNLDLEIE